MSKIFTRKGLLLAAIQPSDGVPVVPTLADAIKVEVSDSPITFNGQSIETNEVRAALDRSESIMGGIQLQFVCSVLLAGSGTAGTEPKWGRLMEACAFKQVVTAAPIGVPTAAAAGTTTTVTLPDAPFSGDDQAYRYMPLALSGNPALPVTTFVSDFDGATGVATLVDQFGSALDVNTLCQIPAHVLYEPHSVQADIPALTFWYYEDGTLTKLFDARGTVQIEIPTGGVGRLNFTFTASPVPDEDIRQDAELPSVSYATPTAPVFRAGRMDIERKPAAISSFSLDSGNEVFQNPDPAAPEGFGTAIISGRRITASLDPEETLVATRNIVKDMRDGTKRLLHLRYGNAPGNRIGLTAAAAKYTGYSPQARNGVRAAGLTQELTGEDAAVCALVIH